MGFWHEFREFAVKGNVLDMAVGIIIGVAFNRIVNSLVNDVLMPPVGLALGGADFEHLQLVLRGARALPTGEAVPAVAIRYGQFANTVIEFAIVALSVFVLVKTVNRMGKLRTQPPTSA
ncbi:MAG: large-conductance mechanosensitive channel protein MscL [Candidatus Latescibacterota bacterium]